MNEKIVRYDEFEVGKTKLRAVVSDGFERLDILINFASIVGGPVLNLIKQVVMKGGGVSDIKESFVDEDGEVDKHKVAEWIEAMLFEAMRNGSREIVTVFLGRTQILKEIKADGHALSTWVDIDLSTLDVKQILTWTFGTFKTQYSEFFPTASSSPNSPDVAALDEEE